MSKKVRITLDRHTGKWVVSKKVRIDDQFKWVKVDSFKYKYDAAMLKRQLIRMR